MTATTLAAGIRGSRARGRPVAIAFAVERLPSSGRRARRAVHAALAAHRIFGPNDDRVAHTTRRHGCGAAWRAHTPSGCRPSDRRCIRTCCNRPSSYRPPCIQRHKPSWCSPTPRSPSTCRCCNRPSSFRPPCRRCMRCRCTPSCRRRYTCNCCNRRPQPWSCRGCRRRSRSPCRAIFRSRHKSSCCSRRAPFSCRLLCKSFRLPASTGARA